MKIGESATGHAILPMDFSLLSWWDMTYMLQIVLIYHGMKLINTFCLSHLCCYQHLARKASPKGDTFSLNFLLNEHSVWNIVSTLFHAWIRIVVHENPLILTWFQLSCVGRFRVQCFFPSYLFIPASKEYRDKSILTFNTWESVGRREIHAI